MTMKRHGWIGLVFTLSVLLTTLPAAGQETVLGRFGGQLGGGNSMTGAATLVGWALADSGIRKVVIVVDGVDFGTAIYGSSRPEVEDLHPGYPDSHAAGFGFRLNTPAFGNGEHTVWARAETFDGTAVVLTPGQYTFHFNNNTSVLIPFGHITRPQDNTELIGVCDLTNPNRRYTVVDGWALDLGVEIGDTGIGYVELMIDGGGPYANTFTSCTYLAAAGGLVNCYGLPRLDVERLYPFAFDSPNSGFRFVLDVGQLIDFGYSRGKHVLTVRAGDISNQFANIDETQVTFLCAEDIPNERAYGRIESPRRGQPYTGDVLVQGWAVDWQGVRAVRIWIDGKFIDYASYGVDSRPSVLADYSGFPDAAAPVYRLFFDSTSVSNGEHELVVRVTDFDDQTTTIGKVAFVVKNLKN